MTGTGGPLRLGTRGSELAVSQTLTVAGRIEELTGAETELVRVRTEGDDLSIPLSAPPRWRGGLRCAGWPPRRSSLD